MKSTYFTSLFKQDSSNSAQELDENSPITTTTTPEPHAKSESVVIKTKDKQSLTSDYHNTTRTTPKKHIAVHAKSRVGGDTTQDGFRDIFTNRLQKAARGLPVTLPELIDWFECDKAQINDLSISDTALRIAVASYVKFGLGRAIRQTEKHQSNNSGMIQCLHCHYWLGDWCSNQDISTGLRNTIDPKRLRRCEGFDRKGI